MKVICSSAYRRGIAGLTFLLDLDLARVPISASHDFRLSIYEGGTSRCCTSSGLISNYSSSWYPSSGTTLFSISCLNLVLIDTLIWANIGVTRWISRLIAAYVFLLVTYRITFLSSLITRADQCPDNNVLSSISRNRSSNELAHLCTGS